ncbi:MAG: amidase [Gammaproteobacteria bacterium]|nr:amidase [Gammaproteobacteria bacterium]NIP88404.1 amidase [Gammaproteobacteria bacterium]NIR22840.1 amidase [Gammaproteobacteria bacterium]NIS04730.1 amidase [Gammaproteobacteria bacterium]NIU40586.1 amidase [Gammaproteobacteria bacterium]
MSEPAFRSLVEAAEAIRTGRISSTELTRACLDRIEAMQGKLNCFVHVHAEQALAAARLADEELAAGKLRGPLHGVPLAHKDCYYREGRLSTCGSPLRGQHIADSTATVLSRLDAAGALDLGGLHMSEWAFGPTGHNEHFGPCRNPWNPAHISGGSSSGSGASVAARLVFAALGSDVGGSIRLPAAACGVVGLKPTLTRVSRHGAMAMCYSLEHVGPLTPSVRDCARILSIVAGHDPRDALSSREPVPDYEGLLDAGIRGMRIGVPVNGFYDHVDDEVGALLERSLGVLRDQGAEIVEVRVPDLDLLARLGKLVMAVEGAAVHGNQIRERGDQYSDQVRKRIEPGFHIPASRYLESLHLRKHFLADIMQGAFAEADVLHAPVLSTPVPTIAETDVKGARNMPEVIGSIIRCTLPVSYLGLPALSVPSGFTSNGLPSAFQLIGRPFAEARLLAVGHAYQRATDWHEQIPALA